MLYIGEILKGKWNKNRYQVLKKLGHGGVGAVYKVKDENGRVKALKISDDMNSITREYENMKKIKMLKIIPKIYEIDDYKKAGDVFYFFILDYIEGYNLKQITKVKQVPYRDVISIALVILKNLKVIYDCGYIYSDVKLENIMIDKRDKKIYLVDFGGLADKSLGFKEYTPTYNSVSWGITNKNNHSTSMVFSVNMLMITMILREEMSPLVNNIKDLEQVIKSKTIDHNLKKIMIKALNGCCRDENKYILELENILCNRGGNFDIVNLIFKGSIFSFLMVITINAIINWM